MEPGGSGKRDLEEMSRRGLSAIVGADEEELPEIKGRVPADRPPEGSIPAHTQSDSETKDENHPDIHHILVRLGEVQPGEDHGRD